MVKMAIVLVLRTTQVRIEMLLLAKRIGETGPVMAVLLMTELGIMMRMVGSEAVGKFEGRWRRRIWGRTPFGKAGRITAVNWDSRGRVRRIGRMGS